MGQVHSALNSVERLQWIVESKAFDESVESVTERKFRRRSWQSWQRFGVKYSVNKLINLEITKLRTFLSPEPLHSFTLCTRYLTLLLLCLD